MRPYWTTGDDKANGTGGSRGVVIVTDAPSVVACAVEIFEADCDPAAHADISIWSNDNVHRFGLPPSGFVPQGGDDWTGKFDHLGHLCRVVYLERTPLISSSMLRDGLKAHGPR